MVKKLFTTAFALFFCAGAFAQGVNFRDISFAEALSQSAAEKKPVFLDCYTDWCGPCKYMASQVFTLKEAGDYFNKRYVSIKIDMEKGEGVELARKYGIRAYPTFLILDSEGNEIHRVVGGGSPGDFIGKVEAGTNMKKPLETLKGEYESGKISKKDLTAYWQLIRANGNAGREEAAAVGEKLYGMLSKSDKLKDIYWALVRNQATSPDSEGMDFVIENRKALSKNIGTDQVNSVISQPFAQAILQMVVNPIKPGQAEKLPVIVSRLKSLDLDNKGELLIMAELAEAKAQGDAGKYIDILGERYGELSEMFLMNALGGANAVAEGEDAKKYYARLSGLTAEIGENSESERLAQFMDAMGKSYARRSNVGVYWENFGSLEDALAQAKKENKRIFLDCYTTWCGPCKYMTENVFTQEEVGDFFNERFINIKIDMEKGEGPEVGKRFGVRAYPTFVIINPDGSMRHVLVGGGEGPAFIERVKESFDDKKALGVSAKKYEDGERDREFLLGYMTALKDNYNPRAADVAQTLFESLGDAEKLSADNWMLFEDTDLSPADSGIEKYLFANMDGFRNSIGKEKVDERIAKPYIQKLMMVIAGRDENTTASDIDRMVKEMKSYGLQSSALAYADVAKLVKKGDRNVKDYKRVTKALAPEENPFLNIYMSQKANMTPAQIKEWKAWGQELADAATDPRTKQTIEMILARE